MNNGIVIYHPKHLARRHAKPQTINPELLTHKPELSTHKPELSTHNPELLTLS